MYQSTITLLEEHIYPVEGLLFGISYQCHINLQVAVLAFKQKIKKDPALLDKLSFDKESGLSKNKNIFNFTYLLLTYILFVSIRNRYTQPFV